MENQELYKQAILDAKAVRETAMAAAKESLAEAFEPRIKEMLRLKLSEELEEAKEEIEEADDNMEEGDYSKMEEGNYDMEESTLDEILAELEAMSDESVKSKMEESDDDVMKEASILTDPNFIGGLSALLGVGGAMASAILKDLKGAKTPQEKKQVLQQAANSISRATGGSDSTSLEEASILTDPNFIGGLSALLGVGGAMAAAILKDLKGAKTPEEKKQVLQQAANSISRATGGSDSGSLMEAEEGEEEATEDKEVVELTVGELKDIFRDVFAQLQGAGAEMGSEEEMGMEVPAGDEEEKEISLDEILAELEEEESKMEEALNPGAESTNKGTPGAYGKGETSIEEAKKKMEEKKKMEKELEEAKKAITTMRSELQEVNLLNAKLLYVNKLLKAKPLTESQKIKVLNAFDRATTVKETENIYKTLNESLTTSATKTSLKESVGYASKPIGSAPVKPIVEVDAMVARWQQIAGIK